MYYRVSNPMDLYVILWKFIASYGITEICSIIRKVIFRRVHGIHTCCHVGHALEKGQSTNLWIDTRSDVQSQ